MEGAASIAEAESIHRDTTKIVAAQINAARARVGRSAPDLDTEERREARLLGEEAGSLYFEIDSALTRARSRIEASLEGEPLAQRLRAVTSDNEPMALLEAGIVIMEQARGVWSRTFEFNGLGEGRYRPATNSEIVQGRARTVRGRAQVVYEPSAFELFLEQLTGIRDSVLAELEHRGHDRAGVGAALGAELKRHSNEVFQKHRRRELL